MAKKLLYPMGEVAEMFDVKPSLLRHWEAKFDILKPKKNKKGNRLFTAEDVENLKVIYHLVKERGMTLDGARRTMERSRTSLTRDVELLERLLKIRAQLAEVREELKSDAGELIGSDDPADEEEIMTGTAAGQPETGEQAVRSAQPEEETDKAQEPVGAVADRPAADAAETVSEADAAGAEALEAGATPAPVPVPARRGRKPAVEKFTDEGLPVDGVPSLKKSRRRKPKENDGEHKELFAFYEQSLF